MGNDANNFIDTALGPGKRHRAKSSSMDEPTVTETAERIGTTRAVEPSPSRAGPTAQSPVNPTLGGSDRSPIQGLLWSPAAQIVSASRLAYECSWPTHSCHNRRHVSSNAISLKVIEV